MAGPAPGMSRVEDLLALRAFGARQHLAHPTQPDGDGQAIDAAHPLGDAKGQAPLTLASSSLRRMPHKTG
jgi:hypothetical protein